MEHFKPTLSRRSWLLLAFLSTLALTFALYHGALATGFARDDGYSLYNVVRLSPYAYFFDPVTLTAIVGSSLTPWGMLVYDVNVLLFGLDPFWHHLHLLLVVWACALATFCLLRLWVTPSAALAGALLFLCGIPLVFMSQEGMTSHYIYGLLFTIGSLHCFVRAVRTASIIQGLLSAVLYLLACSCKEIFVPLPVVLAFLPEGDLKSRLRWSAGLWGVAIAYTAWRWVVFGPGLLGPRGVPIDPVDALQQVAGIPALMLGPAWPLFAVIPAVAVWRKAVSPRAALALLVLCATLLLPLLPVTPNIGIREPGRLLILPWWVVACLSTIGLSSLLSRHKLACCALLMAAATSQVAASLPWRAEMAQTKQQWAAWNRFVLEPSGKPQALVLLNDNSYFWQKYHIEGLRMAARVLGLPFNASGRVVTDQHDFADAVTASPGGMMIYDQGKQVLRAARDAQELHEWSGKLTPKRAGVHVFRGVPRLGFQRAGVITAVATKGKTVAVTGQVPASRTGQNFMLLVPESCSPDAMQRSEVAGGSTSFEVSVVCASPQGAARVASLLCLVSSNGGEIFVPGNQPNPDCSRLADR